MEKQVLKSEFKIHDAMFGATKKAIRKKKTRAFSDVDYDLLDEKLTNGKTAGQELKEAGTCGKCYFYALMIAYGFNEGRLVHGVLHKLDATRNDGGSYDEFEHAWVEVDDDLVYDPTVKTVFDREAYEKAFDVERRKVFPVRELMNNTEKFQKVAREAAEKAFSNRQTENAMLELFPQFEKTKV